MENECKSLVTAIFRSNEISCKAVFSEAENIMIWPEALKTEEELIGGIRFDKKWADNSLTPFSLGVATTPGGEEEKSTKDGKGSFNTTTISSIGAYT